MFKPNLEALRDRVKRIQEKRTREGSINSEEILSNFAFPQVGNNFIWVLPPWKDEMVDYGKFVAYHKNIPNIEGKLHNYRCRKYMAGESCTICDSLVDLAPFVDVSGEDDYTKKMTVQFCYWINVIVYTKEDNGGKFIPVRQKPSIYRLTERTYEGILVEIIEEEAGDISDPYDGFIVKIKRPKDFSGQNNYEVRLYKERMEMPIDPDFEGPSSKWIQGALKELHNLDEIFSIPDEELIIGAAKEMMKHYEINSNLEIKKNDDNIKVDESERREAPKPERVREITNKKDENCISEPDNIIKDVINGERDKTSEDCEMITIDNTDYIVIKALEKGIEVIETENGDTMYCCSICRDKVWKSEGWVNKHIEKTHSAVAYSATTENKKIEVIDNKGESDEEEEIEKSKQKKGLPIPPGAPSCIGEYGKCKGAKKTFCEYDNYCKKISGEE